MPRQSRWRRLWYGDDPANAKVIPLAFVLILVQALYRGWAAFHSWWQGDDLLFIARVFGPGGVGMHNLLASYVGHMLPGALYVTWLINKASPYSYSLAAMFLVVMQVLAGVGFMRLMLLAFGRRWGIIPPLVLFLATAFTAQSAVWWANGVQALPLCVSFTWALGSQVKYLQSRNPGHALAAMLWVVFGLLFFEKALLVIGAMAIISICYYTTGTARQRVVQLWTTYRISVVGNFVLGAVYIPLYVHFALSFSTGSAVNYPIGPTADVIILRTWPTGLLGGPLKWAYLDSGQVNFAAPPGPFVVFALVVVFGVVRALARSRTCSLRALLLPAFFLVCDTLLVVAGRAFAFGALIGYEYRYISELAVVTAVALAFATMPAIGAVEKVEQKRADSLLDNKQAVAAACAAIVVLGTVSTAVYYNHWRLWRDDKSYFTNLIADAHRAPPHTQAVDAVVPPTLLGALAYPGNTISRLLAPTSTHLTFTTVATDHLVIPDASGHLRPLELTPVRRGQPGPAPDCGYRIGHAITRIPLDGPALFGGWWIRLGYLATADSALTVSAGGRTYETNVEPGFHALYFRAGDNPFQAIKVGGLIGEATMCTDDVSVGRAQAQGTP